jgi:hypothetical protein
MEDTRDATETKFYEAVGRCIKIWAGVENYLFDICVELLETSPQIAGVIFFRTPTIDARLTLVSDLFLARFLPRGLKSGDHMPKIIDDWQAIHVDLKNRLGPRNLAAHSPVSTSYFGKVDQTTGDWIGESTWWVREHAADAVRPKSGKIRTDQRKELGTEALLAHVEEIKPIIKRMVRLLEQLEGRREAPSQPKPVPTRKTPPATPNPVVQLKPKRPPRS